ncbi:MAG: insulinase family protein, partial [Candidatus Aminicenantes bacterium]
MKNLRKTLLVALWVVLALSSVVAQQATQQVAQQTDQAAVPPAQYALDQKIPVDPRITVGQLPNGLRYWIRENREPKNRAELRLVVNAGSVLEDEDQRGLAHVVEHLAFNGSTHFPKQKLIEFMES